MNIKAERIEQMIQIINRNLLVAFSGQTNGMAPLEFKKLQKIETGIFGHDKFAFEMVHFVKTSRDQQFEGTIAQTWERIFLRGLETLLVECAIVRDDIERDCFVSRVYGWFTEKLVERRGLPRTTSQGRFASLVDTIKTYGNSEHTMKGLEKFVAEAEHGGTAGSTRERTRIFEYDKDVDPPEAPTIRMPSAHGRAGTRTGADFVNNGFPEVLKPRVDYQSFLPKIPDTTGANYGMIYNKPETEAEKNINELWIARRRQEAFEWKTQQHLSLVMDRLDLHKSRIESEALRRLETSANLADSHARPRTAGTLEDHLSGSRCFSPKGKRPMSGKKKQLLEARAEFVRSLREQSLSPERERKGSESDNYRSDSAKPSARTARSRPTSSSRQNSARLDLIEDQTMKQRIICEEDEEDDVDGVDGHVEDDFLREPSCELTKLKVCNDNGTESESIIQRPGRSLVPKAPPKREILPMRFRHDPPEKFIKHFEKQQYYMELSDSDDEDKPDRIASKPKGRAVVGSSSVKKGGAGNAPSGGGNKKQAGKGGVTVVYKRDKLMIRERPVSARQFRIVSQNDPEFKIHYRYSNFRRMPLTAEQEQWITTREAERAQKSLEMAQELAAAAALKAEKKKNKDKGGGDANQKSKSSSAKKKAAEVEVPVKPKPKYKSAAEYMRINFPNFDGDRTITGDCTDDAHGPMRTMQLIECAQVAEAFARRDLPIKESALYNALVVPQDRPEAICLENMKAPGDGLMVNPVPMEYWRKVVDYNAKKKGGKRKKK